jgi:uracil-DNA glycosylase
MSKINLDLFEENKFELPTAPASSLARLNQWQPHAWAAASDWQPTLARFLAGEPARKLGDFVNSRIGQGAAIYPPQPFHALALTPLKSVKVVILGQDPYHGAGQAHGLAFSVPPGVRIPPSLRNIQKEIQRDAAQSGLALADLQLPGGSLERWARQGVLLLNTCLTVEDGAPASHAKQGWEVLTDGIIQAVCATQPCVVFMLWGAHAQAKEALVRQAGQLGQAGPLGQVGPSHRVLLANHPSPLSALRPPRPFLGCGHFGLANTHLEQNGLTPVAW